MNYAIYITGHPRTIMTSSKWGFRGSLICSPWCREAQASRSVVGQIAVGSFPDTGDAGHLWLNLLKENKIWIVIIKYLRIIGHQTEFRINAKKSFGDKCNYNPNWFKFSAILFCNLSGCAAHQMPRLHFMVFFKIKGRLHDAPPGCKKISSQASRGIMGVQLRTPVKTLNTIVLWLSERFQGRTELGLRDVRLSDSCASDRCCLFQFGENAI